MKVYKSLLVGLFICALVFGGCSGKSYLESSPNTENEAVTDSYDNSKEQEILNIYVQVGGAVKSPGVYACPPDTRLFKVIEMAGGLLEEAAIGQINQARVVSDGESIYVPTMDEIALCEGDQENTYGQDVYLDDSRININRADISQLTSLPGIGEKKAQDIVDYRLSQGIFSSIEDIKNISGIGEKLFDKIKDLITV